MIATVAALIATATTGLVVALWWGGTAGLSGAELVNARFNALRTGLSIGVGGGGIFALYLAWRRQHATEIGLVQKERDQADVARAYELQRETAEHTERDAAARRITDLYAKSVEQLGSDKAPVRHGGLYALERLAQDHPDNPALRQTVVNVLCAYLRAPFELPGDPPDTEADQTIRSEYRERVQEREVRLTAQRILTTHLNPGSNADHPTTTFWADTDLDLTAAVLIDWDMSDCLLRNVTFRRANFIGDAWFRGATFTKDAWFRGATFSKDALFDEATFTRDALFGKAAFAGNAVFRKVKFTGNAWFSEATFAREARFSEARFTEEAVFLKVTFTGRAVLREATFTEDASFSEATFTREASFDEATFTRDAVFSGTTFTRDAVFSGTTFTGEAVFREAKFTRDAWFNEATFTGDVLFSEAAINGDIVFSEAVSRHQFSTGWIHSMSWPIGWQLSPDHTAIEGRDGTWHRILAVDSGPAHFDARSSESASD
ncbi:pentapeptide repeat-containing protein [Saccharothrix saharensis]|uniref:pentapeptide repeat-containing protein n=1 Tax=Saccharothrix saharensis TaxID=571190 RepID=UPI00367B71FF